MTQLPQQLLNNRSRIAMQLRSMQDTQAQADDPNRSMGSFDPSDEPNEPVTTEQPAETRSEPSEPGISTQELLRQNRELMQQLGRLTTALSASREQPEPEPEEPDINLPIQPVQVSDEDRETYRPAENFVRSLIRDELSKAMQTLLPEVNSMRKRLASTEKSVTGKIGQATERTFSTALYAAIPDFDQLRRHPKYEAFLDKPVPFTGTSVRAALSAAYGQQNLGPIREAFDEFRRTLNKEKPVSGRDKFMSAASNSSGYAASPDADPQKNIMFASDRQKDYNKFRAGNMTPEDWARKQAEYDTAMLEGRYDATR